MVVTNWYCAITCKKKRKKKRFLTCCSLATCRLSMAHELVLGLGVSVCYGTGGRDKRLHNIADIISLYSLLAVL